MKWLLLVLVCAGLGCNPEDIQETVIAYYGDLDANAQAAEIRRMARVMPFYVTGTCLALLLMLVATANGLEHARNLGRSEAVRFGAYVFLLCFVSLFLAMEFDRAWLPAGHALSAFGITALFSAATTAAAARASPERAVLLVGYLSVTLVLPLTGILLSREVYLMDTTASLFIGFATGLLLTIVFSDPVRGGLVDFLRRRDED